MADVDFSTYDGLKAAVASWLNRRDLTDQIPGFVKLAEANFNRKLRVRDMQKRSSATSANEYIEVPGDYRQEVSLEIAQGDSNRWGPPLRFIGEKEARELRAERYGRPNPQPEAYTIFGGEFEIVPAPTGSYDYKLKYLASIPALATGNQTNWLLTKSPDLYLYGALLQAAPYLKNDERVTLWANAVQSTIDDMNLESERAQRSQVQLAAKRRTFG